jgi:hypothetical protein
MKKIVIVGAGAAGATKINVVAEELGMKFLNSNMARNRDLAATSISCADYYRQLFPNL